MEKSIVKKFFVGLFFLCICLTETLLACFAPKQEQIVSTQDLVKRTKDIYLAEASGAESKQTVFKVLKTLKGKQIDAFKLESSIIMSENETDFHRHTDKSFWEPSGGRVQIGADCKLSMSFQKGKKYVIFYNKPYHFKSFELIESDNDIWLAFVQKKAKK
jgi:hypothetical protein